MEERRQAAPAEQGRYKALERFLAERGIGEEAALRLLTQTLRQQEDLRARALETVAAIRAIDDPRFTVSTIRAHPEALRALEAGESVGKVYRRYFLAGGDAAEQAEANLGLGLPQGERLTAEEIERISAQVDRTGRYDLSGY